MVSYLFQNKIQILTMAYKAQWDLSPFISFLISSHPSSFALPPDMIAYHSLCANFLLEAPM